MVNGYLNVTLGVHIQGRKARRRYPVHRLVCLAFHGEPPCADRNLARHLNGNCIDNHASNLAWGSFRDNAQDAIRHGTLGRGMRARHRKLTDAQVQQIRERRSSGESDKALAVEFGVSRYYPTRLASGLRWGHLS